MKAPSRTSKRWLVGLMALAVVFGLVSIAAATLIGSGFETLTLGNYYYIGDTVEFYGYAFNDTTAEPILSAEVTEVFVRRYDGTAPSGYQDIYLLEASDPPIQLPSIDDKVLFYPDKMVIDYADATPDETVFTDYSNALSWTLAADTPLDANQRFKAEWHVLGFQENADPAAPWDEFEKIDTVRRTLLKPSTIADVSATPTTVLVGGTVDVTVTEFNNGNAALATPAVDVLINGVPYDTLTKASAPTGDTLDDGILGIGETWSWTIPGVAITEDTTIKVIGHGIDPNGNDVTVPADPAMAMPWEDPDEEAAVEVDTISPNTKMTVDALDPSVFYVGDTVAISFHEQNTGDVALTSVHAKIFVNDVEVLDIPKGSDLAVGETWDFGFSKEAVEGGETICAIGFGTDPLGNVITFDPQNPEKYPEKACVDYETVNPGTEMTVDALASSTLYVGDPITVSAHEQNTGNCPLTNVYAEIWVDGVMVDTILKGSDLAVGETWDFTYDTLAVDGDHEICVIGFGTDCLGNEITYPDYPEKDCVRYSTITPGTEMTVDALPNGGEYDSGADVTAHFHEANSGDVVLTDVKAEIWVDGVLVDTILKGADLVVGETWDFDYTVSGVTAAGEICAVGFGTDPLGNVITFPDYPEKACVSWTVRTYGPTRTVGFWGQHYDYTLHVFSTELGGSIPLCDGKPIDSIQKVMAILNYDSILSKKEVAKMTPYEIKWLNCARQYVAAVLNYEAFGTAPEYMGEPIDFADVRMALCTGDADAIGDYLMKLDWFNNSHDDEYMYPLYGADEHFGPDENYWAPASPQKARFEGSSAIIWVRNLPVMP